MSDEEIDKELENINLDDYREELTEYFEDDAIVRTIKKKLKNILQELKMTKLLKERFNRIWKN